MKYFIAVCFSALALTAFILPPSPAVAQDGYINIEDDDEVSITGTVESVDYESFMLNTASGEFMVTVDDIDLDADLREFLEEDMQVYVSGELEERVFDRPFIQAEDFRVIGTADEEAADILIIEEDDDEAFIED